MGCFCVAQVVEVKFQGRMGIVKGHSPQVIFVGTLFPKNLKQVVSQNADELEIERCSIKKGSSKLLLWNMWRKVITENDSFCTFAISWCKWIYKTHGAISRCPKAHPNFQLAAKYRGGIWIKGKRTTATWAIMNWYSPVGGYHCRAHLCTLPLCQPSQHTWSVSVETFNLGFLTAVCQTWKGNTSLLYHLFFQHGQPHPPQIKPSLHPGVIWWPCCPSSKAT